MAEVAPQIPVVILCGGEPIVWHVVQIYAVQGVRDVVLATGYKHDVMEEFVRSHDWPQGIDIQCVETGLNTPTGGRIKLLEDRLGDEPFFATYGDGVADVDLGELWAFHRAHGGLATMTVVRPLLQFGITDLDGDGVVSGFHEKPRSEHWINGGFFCFEPGVFDYLDRSSVLEREPLEGLAADGELAVYRHDGFWQCADTVRDVEHLRGLWDSGRAPWRVWDDRRAATAPDGSSGRRRADRVDELLQAAAR
jgi:glucose-1-phosphate cytidylyltransferase